jgi:catechol 2,3-dioxygenase-like lactoylglutathione lyase family enzyme
VITALVGITLWTDNLEGLFDFYHRLLGLPLHSRHDDFIALELGGVRFNLGRHREVRGTAKDPYRVMPHLGVDDIHGEYRRLTQAGVTFIRPPEREHWGGWICTLRDPDGNVLQLLQLPASR